MGRQTCSCFLTALRKTHAQEVRQSLTWIPNSPLCRPQVCWSSIGSSVFPRNSFRSRSLCLFDSEDSIIAAPWPNNAETELVFKTCKLTVSFIFCQKVSEFAVDAQELPRFFHVFGVSQLSSPLCCQPCLPVL